MITEKPILFSTPMVQAILAGKKTMTRRVIKKEVELAHPRYALDDVLWVRETFGILSDLGNYNNGKDTILYKATEERKPYDTFMWKPSIFMPRAASRITLKVTDVKIQLLQEITEEDARAEGITDGGCTNCGNHEPCGCDKPSPDARDSFIWLWDSINEKRGYGWGKDQWVYAIRFEVQ